MASALIGELDRELGESIAHGRFGDALDSGLVTFGGRAKGSFSESGDSTVGLSLQGDEGRESGLRKMLREEDLIFSLSFSGGGLVRVRVYGSSNGELAMRGMLGRARGALEGLSDRSMTLLVRDDCSDANGLCELCLERIGGAVTVLLALDSD